MSSSVVLYNIDVGYESYSRYAITEIKVSYLFENTYSTAGFYMLFIH